MFAGPAEDRLAIRERIEAYGDAVFRHDAQAWIANWAEDGVWRLPGIEVAGKARIKAVWEEAMANFAHAAFFSVPGQITVTGEAATARSYTQEVLIDHAGAARRVVGVYDDTLVRQGGAWLFTSRAYTVLHDDAAGSGE